MKHILSLAFVVLLVSSAVAQTSWKLDKSHSNVKFAVTHLVIAEVEGRFTDFDATITHTNEDLTDAKIEATIKTASINTDSERRDNHLKSDDFFNAEKFPELKFVSTKMEKTGDKTYKIHGDLTIRDVTKPVVLDTKFMGTIKDARGTTKAGFRATTTIDRFEFGTTWSAAIESGALVVGKEIEITLLMEFNQINSGIEPGTK
ncbi:MAG: YceI family protein [Bacteroidota bacterium]